MDTTNQSALTQAHQNLADDLANLSQLIEPQNQQALSMLYRVQRRLEDIEQLARFGETRKTQTDVLADGSTIDVIDLLVDRLEGAEAICDMLAVLAAAEETDLGSDLCSETMHRAAFTARNLVTECLQKTKVWNAQYASREAS